jgi:hypothetical protein
MSTVASTSMESRVRAPTGTGASDYYRDIRSRAARDGMIGPASFGGDAGLADEVAPLDDVTAGLFEQRL